MQLLHTTTWCWYDIGFLKWCAFLTGLAGGAYLAEMVRPHLALCLGLAAVCSVRPAYVYFRAGRGDRGPSA